MRRIELGRRKDFIESSPFLWGKGWVFSNSLHYFSWVFPKAIALLEEFALFLQFDPEDTGTPFKPPDASFPLDFLTSLILKLFSLCLSSFHLLRLVYCSRFSSFYLLTSCWLIKIFSFSYRLISYSDPLPKLIYIFCSWGMAVIIVYAYGKLHVL